VEAELGFEVNLLIHVDDWFVGVDGIFVRHIEWYCWIVVVGNAGCSVFGKCW
jgi:hypothetical protein